MLFARYLNFKHLFDYNFLGNFTGIGVTWTEKSREIVSSRLQKIKAKPCCSPLDVQE